MVVSNPRIRLNVFLRPPGGKMACGRLRAALYSGMQPVLPLTVAVMTFNEERNLPRCLESVRGLPSEIVVVDSGSTDRTVEIARSHGARVVTEPWAGFVGQRKKSLDHSSQPWVLCLDADEAVSPELAVAVREAFQRGEPAVDGFWLNRRSFYLGAWIWHAWYPEWRLRLVRRGRATPSGQDPHEHITVPGATEQISGDLLHYSFRDLRDHLDRTIRYAQINADGLARKGRRCRWHHLLLWPWAAFFKRLLVRQGWRDGWRGWLIAFSSWLSVFAKYAFLLEKQLNPRSSEVEKR